MQEYFKANMGISSGLGHDVYYFISLGSTNTYLKNRVKDFPEGKVIWAGFQTAGRGRGNHSWYSPPAHGLYFSVLLKAPRMQELQLISLMAALALKSAIESNKIFPKHPKYPVDLKYPNDIYIDNRKIAGILCEAVTEGSRMSVIVGIGLNVLKPSQGYSEEIRGKAGALEEFYPGEWESNALLREILLELEYRYRHFDPYAIVQEYREKCRHWGKRGKVELDGGSIEGVIKGIDDSGALLLVTDEGVKRVLSGSLIILK